MKAKIFKYIIIAFFAGLYGHAVCPDFTFSDPLDCAVLIALVASFVALCRVQKGVKND